MSSDKSMRIELDAMRSDSSSWSDAASRLRGPVASAGELNLTGPEMSYFATELGLDVTYESARIAIEDMLNEAADYFQKISDNLESAAKQYEQDDADAAHQLNKAAKGN